MRQLLRSPAFRLPTRASVPEYRPEASEEKFKSWWSRLNSLSSKPASKVYLAQLSNLLAYYNRQVKDTTQVTQTARSPSTSPAGRARSSRRDLWKASRGTMRSWPRRSTTSTRSSMTSSPRTPRPSTKSYSCPHAEQRNGLPHCHLARELWLLCSVAVRHRDLRQHPRLLRSRSARLLPQKRTISRCSDRDSQLPAWFKRRHQSLRVHDDPVRLGKENRDILQSSFD